MPRYAGVNAPGPGSLVDLQHPLGYGCVGCWWPNAAPDAGSGLWIPDLSGYGMTLTYSAGTALPWYPGEHAGEWCLYGAGKGYWYTADAPHFNALEGTHGLTMMFTGSIDVSTTNFQGLFVSNSGWYIGGGLWSQRDSEGNRWIRMSRDNYSATWTTPETFSDWYHLVGVYDNHTEYLYNEGVQVATIYCPYHVGTFPGIRICNEAVYGGNLLGRWSSAIIWNRALAPEEVAWLYREPAAMMWEPGRKRTFLFGTVAGLTAELADTATGTDSIAALLACTATLADDGTGADSLTAKAAFAAALTDAATGADDLSAAAALLVSLADTATGADTLEALYAATVLLGDDGTGADTLDALTTILVELSDAAGGSDALSASLAAIATLDDTVEGADTLGAVAAYLATLADGAEGSDALSLLAAVAGIRHVLTIRDKRRILTIQDLREALTVADRRDITTLK